VKYVGNPVKEIVGHHEYDPDWARLFGIKETGNLIALFPGSRKGEIQLNLPYQLKAAEMLKKEDQELRFAISCAHDTIMPVMHKLLAGNSLKLNKDIFLLPKGYSYELMRDCRSAIAKSGTVTLELALHKRPTVVMYKLTLLNRILAKYWMRLKLPHYCIVNILRAKKVFPELIAKGLTSQNLYQEVKALHYDSAERSRCIEECEALEKDLQDFPASRLAAQAVEELFR
jgi:lipid-A-disaccharide synthase